jgi:uncharacterized membrane protein
MGSHDLAGLVEHADTVRILLWCVVGFAALWLVTSVLGYFHRRTYNLTYADSAGGQPITPDFLKVDKEKRKAALERGAAYDTTLGKREASAVEKVCFWSRLGATAAALLALGATVIGTVSKIDSIQKGVEDIGSWDKFAALISQNKLGATVAVVVIVFNVGVFVHKQRAKTTATA